MNHIHQLRGFRFAAQHYRVLHARGVDQARAVVAFAARGWGKTQVSLHLAVQAALQAPAGDTALWLTPVVDQFRASWRALKSVYQQHIVRAVRSEGRVDFAHAGALEFRSAFEPDHLRGKTYRAVVLDEAALVLEEGWQTCIRPTQRRADDWFVLLTTPRGRDWVWQEYQRGVAAGSGGKENKKERMEKGEEGAEQIQRRQDAAGTSRQDAGTTIKPNAGTTSKACVPLRFPAVWTGADGREQFAANVDPARVIAARDELSDERFAQEYGCSFAESAAICFRDVPAHVLTAAEDAAAVAEAAATRGPYVIGVDWGFAHDYTVACVIALTTGRIVKFARTRRVSSQVMCKSVADLAHEFGDAFCLCDVTSLQDQALGALKTAGTWAAGFVFTQAAKGDMIEQLLMSWDRMQMRVPAYGPLIDELQTFEARYTPATRQRTYGAAPGRDHHDDCIMALALAWWARANYPGSWHVGDAIAEGMAEEEHRIDWENYFV